MKKLLLSVAVILCVAATPIAAEAQSRSFHAPWGGGVPVSAYLGTVNSFYGPMNVIFWFERGGGRCKLEAVSGPPLTDTVYVNGTNGDDFLNVLWGGVSQQIYCEGTLLTLTDFRQESSSWLILKGWAGNDTLWGGAGRSEVYGGEGNDYILGNTTGGACHLFGGPGNDNVIFQGSSTSAVVLGDAEGLFTSGPSPVGDDCLMNNGNPQRSSTILACGPGSDKVAGAGDTADCEMRVSSCYP